MGKFSNRADSTSNSTLFAIACAEHQYDQCKHAIAYMHLHPSPSFYLCFPEDQNWRIAATEATDKLLEAHTQSSAVYPQHNTPQQYTLTIGHYPYPKPILPFLNFLVMQQKYQIIII